MLEVLIIYNNMSLKPKVATKDKLTVGASGSGRTEITTVRFCPDDDEDAQKELLLQLEGLKYRDIWLHGNYPKGFEELLFMKNVR